MPREPSVPPIVQRPALVGFSEAWVVDQPASQRSSSCYAFPVKPKSERRALKKLDAASTPIVVALLRELGFDGLSEFLPLLRAGGKIWAAHRIVKIANETDAALSDIAAALRMDPEDIAAEVHSLEEPVLLEILGSGMEALMSSMSEKVRPCVAALIADYYKNATEPDLFYRRTLQLLQDSEPQELRCLESVCRSAAKLQDLEVTANGAGTRHASGVAGECMVVSNDPAHSMCFIGDHGRLAQVGETLLRHGFCDSDKRRSGSRLPEFDPLMTFAKPDWIARLGLYLGALQVGVPAEVRPCPPLALPEPEVEGPRARGGT